MTEKQIVDRLYERDAVVRQAQLVTDWLESNAADDLDDYYDRLEFFADPRGSRENTCHHLKQKRIGNNTGSDRPLVHQLVSILVFVSFMSTCKACNTKSCKSFFKSYKGYSSVSNACTIHWLP